MLVQLCVEINAVGAEQFFQKAQSVGTKATNFGLSQPIKLGLQCRDVKHLWKIQTLDKASHNHSIGLSANILIVFHVRDPSDSTPLVFQTRDRFNLLKVISTTNMNFIERQCSWCRPHNPNFIFILILNLILCLDFKS